MSHYLQLTVGRQHSVFISVCLYFIVIKQEHTESLHSPSLIYQYMTFNKSIICWTPSIICGTGSIIWWTEGPSYDGPRPRYDGWGPSYDGYHFSSNLLNLWFSVAQELKNSYSNFTVKFCFWYLISLPSYSYLSGFGWFGVHHIMDLVHHIMAPLSII